MDSSKQALLEEWAIEEKDLTDDELKNHRQAMDEFVVEDWDEEEAHLEGDELAAHKQAKADILAELAGSAEAKTDPEVESAKEIGKTAARATVVRFNNRGEHILDSDYDALIDGGNRK